MEINECEGLHPLSHIYVHPTALPHLQYSMQKRSREKTLTNFAILQPFAKFSPQNLGMPHPLCDQFNILREFSPCFLPICESFLRQKFLLVYTAEISPNVQQTE